MTPKIFELAGKRVFVAGHRGMVGSAILRRLDGTGCTVVTADRCELDLERQEQTERFITKARPDVVIVAAAKVGGIHANDAYPAEFISENLAIARNAIDASHKASVRKLLFLGSSCIYPREARQPMREDELLTGPLEPTNEWYAIAKIAGIKLCQAYRRQYGADFISVMPTNLYGPGDNYHAENSHVVSALIRRLHEAKRVGAPSVTVCGQEVTIADLAKHLAEIVQYPGKLEFDHSRPDGMPRKLLDSSVLTRMGWHARTPLREGLERAYVAYLAGNARAH
jgi:GDP-L-fucose synthase